MSRPTMMALRAAAAREADIAAARALGRALTETGAIAEAVPLLERAVARDAQDPGGHLDLAAALAKAGRVEPAFAHLARARALDAAAVGAWLQTASFASTQGREDEAFRCLVEAIRLAPTQLALYVQAARCCVAGRAWREAVEHLSSALPPTVSASLVSQGVARAIMYEGRYEEARACYHALLREAPDDPQCLVALGCIAFVLHDAPEALRQHERAWRLYPADHDVFYFYLFDLCLLGRLAEARRLVDSWKQQGGRLGVRPADYGQPECDVRGPLDGKTVLCHGGFGHGDTLIMARFTAALKARGATVIVESGAALTSILRSVPWVDTAVSRYEPCAPFDFEYGLDHGWLLSDCGIDGLGADVPYLAATPAAIDTWRPRLRPEPGVDADALTVGLVWRCGSPMETDPYFNRSMPIAQVLPLLSTPGVRFYLLQADVTDQERAACGDGAIDLGSAFRDFLDSAAVVRQLDLVITVDTAMAHLAGALGVPTFVMMPYTSWGWRWFPDRHDSPWYPHTRLFWQPEPGAWTPVVADVARALGDLASNLATSGLPRRHNERR